MRSYLKQGRLGGRLILGAAGFGNAIGPHRRRPDRRGQPAEYSSELPIAAFAMLVTQRIVRADRGTLSDHRVDYGGIALLSIGLLALLFALDQGIDLGWTDPLIVGLSRAPR
jgi:hypothetical protein